MQTTRPTVSPTTPRHRLMLSASAAILAAGIALAAPESPKTVLKTEQFDRDPDWEGHNNRIVLESVPTVKQDFGYSASHFAGKSAGEIGGKVTRATKPAYYAARIAPKTLDDKLTASGSFAITASQGGAGVFFGWFNSQQPGGSGRPIGSLGLHLDFEQAGGRLAVRLLTGENQGCGTFVTKYEQYRKIELKKEMRPTPLKNDGTRYHWTLSYDPQGNDGGGRFEFTVKSDSATPADFEGKTFSVDVPAGYKKQGTTFDRFGLMNMMKAGGVATIYFDDIQLDDQKLDFTNDPNWVGAGNRDSYEDREQVGAHNFGFNNTSFAGGSAGEIGGDFWRSGAYAYLGDRVGPLNLEQRLEARGKVTMVVGGPDADMMLGWFSSSHKDKSPIEAGDFLGVAVGGPTRVGHYFAPSFTTGKGARGSVETAPVLKPGNRYDWSLLYDPAANEGSGEIKLTLGGESVVLPLKPGRKADGATFDRFGLFTSQAGGQLVRIYLDDLTYTAATSTATKSAAATEPAQPDVLTPK